MNSSESNPIAPSICDNEPLTSDHSPSPQQQQQQHEPLQQQAPPKQKKINQLVRNTDELNIASRHNQHHHHQPHVDNHQPTELTLQVTSGQLGSGTPGNGGPNGSSLELQRLGSSNNTARGMTPTRTVSGRVIGRTPSKLESYIDPNSPMAMRVHRCPINSLVTQFHTDLKHGLPAEHRTTGLNQVTSPPDNTARKVLGYVFGGFNAVMWIAMILAIISYKPLGGDNPQIVSLGVAIVLFLVILFSSVFYARVDFAASKMMDAMRGMVANDCMVIRDGNEMLINANDVSVGDILVLSLGQRVAADVRLIECSSDLAFDRSLLTGEADPISGSTQCTDKNVLETKNIALSSSFVLRGNAKAVVYAIGDDTVIGQIVKLASKPKQKPTPIQQEIHRFTIIVSSIAFGSFILAIILWATWQRTTYPGFNTAGSAIVNAIGCLCALVPQGLPVAFALSLSIIASKMADAKVLVKNLSTIETLGSMSLICSDKTGTLTTGKMTVQKCLTLEHEADFAQKKSADLPNNISNVTNVGNDPFLPTSNADDDKKDGEVVTSAIDSLPREQQDRLLTTKSRASATAILARASSHHSSGPKFGLQESIKTALQDSPTPSTFAVHRIASLCCGAVFLPQLGGDELPVEQRATNGDPTDTAVLKFTYSAKPFLGIKDKEHEYDAQYAILYTLPFNSNNKFMATVVIERFNPDAKPIILFKGAPDIILTKCSKVFTNNGDSKLGACLGTDYEHHYPTDVIQQRTKQCPLDDVAMNQLTDMKNNAASQGLRVIALAQVEVEDLIQIPELATIVESPNDLDENNESDDEDQDDHNPTDIVVNIISKDEKNQVEEPTSPVQVQPKAHYQYPQDWEGYLLQTIARKQCTFAGCLAIMDPPRSDVPDTVATMATAGVAVAMVTGDFQLTAQAIARRVNIITCPDSNVFSAKDLAKLQLNYENVHKYPDNPIDMKPPTTSDPTCRNALILNGPEVATLSAHDWDFVCSYFHEFVFARTTPEHKQTIVEEFKRHGRVVAVTGDGVNDVAALKSADIGVAMGAGADLAKDAASIVLLENSFSALLVGLIYGRLVFQNLRKIVMYLMCTGALVEFLAVVVNVLLGTPLPLSSFLQVVFCAFNDIVMSISLMFEQPEGDILDAPPRDVRKDRLVDFKWFMHCLFQYGLITFICSIGMWFMTMHDYNIGFLDVILAFNKWTDGFKGHSKAELAIIVNKASCAYYVCMVWCNFGNLLSIRTRRASLFQSSPLSGENKNLAIPICMFISLCIAFFVLYLPGLPSVVGTARINWKYWVIPISFPFGILLIDETRKYLVRNTHWMAKIAW